MNMKVNLHPATLPSVMCRKDSDGSYFCWAPNDNGFGTRVSMVADGTWEARAAGQIIATGKGYRNTAKNAYAAYITTKTA